MWVKFRCESMAPFGRPVEPDVYTMVARSSALTRSMASSSSASLTALPKSTTASMPSVWKLNTYWKSSCPSRSSSSTWAWLSSPAKAMTGLTSLTMFSACLAESVS